MLRIYNSSKTLDFFISL